EAAYRFCSRQAGVDLVLVGTGSKEHLSENVDAINGAPLPRQILERIDAVFGGVSSVSGD
ncbi:MAG: aldo/keto reductase, partial [Pseudomonadota bacterium]|nr:aldo/keto reductase [Pseudomonadota bacterium]